MLSDVIVSYMNFILLLLVLSGWFILQIDVNRYKRRKMEKELKASKWLGWMNVALGAVGFLWNLFYR